MCLWSLLYSLCTSIIFTSLRRPLSSEFNFTTQNRVRSKSGPIEVNGKDSLVGILDLDITVVYRVADVKQHCTCCCFKVVELGCVNPSWISLANQRNRGRSSSRWWEQLSRNTWGGGGRTTPRCWAGTTARTAAGGASASSTTSCRPGRRRRPWRETWVSESGPAFWR